MTRRSLQQRLRAHMHFELFPSGAYAKGCTPVMSLQLVVTYGISHINVASTVKIGQEQVRVYWAKPSLVSPTGRGCCDPFLVRLEFQKRTKTQGVSTF